MTKRHPASIDDPGHAALDQSELEMLDALQGLFHCCTTGTDASAYALEAVMFCAEHRLVAPAWAANAAVAAFKGYQDFEHASLGDAFGLKDHTRLKRQQKKRMRTEVAYEVQALREGLRGMPLSREEAIASSAAKRGWSESTIRDLVKEWEDLCRQLGLHPYNGMNPPPHPGPSAARIISAITAEALSPHGKADKKTR